jgi:cell division septum initiation protein DivIVA
MDIDFLIDRLEGYILEESPKLLGNRLVNEDEVRGYLAQLRQAVPEEIEQARRIMRERDAVIDRARQEAEGIIAKARDEGERMVSSHQFVVDAQRQARVIVQEARQEAEGLRSDANEYVFDTLSQLQAELTRQLRVVENGLHRLETEREEILSKSEDEG